MTFKQLTRLMTKDRWFLEFMRNRNRATLATPIYEWPGFERWRMCCKVV
jgi:hypothetical protein